MGYDSLFSFFNFLKNKGYQKVLATAKSSSIVLILLCFKGWQTGQSIRVQCRQWWIICLDEEQWGTGHDFPDWHDFKWMSTSFIVRQGGKEHWKKKNSIHFGLLFTALNPIFVIKYGSEEKGSSLSRCSILLGFIMSKNPRGLWFYLLIKVQNANSLVFLT